MSYRVDPGVTAELGQYGGETAVKCFNCGNCTAVCALTEPGLHLSAALHPLHPARPEGQDARQSWTRGSATTAATARTPARAKREPGKLMMASRRWLISMYDWTGLSRLMYRHERWELAMLGLVAAGGAGLVHAAGGVRLPPAGRASRGAPERELALLRAEGDRALGRSYAGGCCWACLLLSNAARMVWYVHAPRAAAACRTLPDATQGVRCSRPDAEALARLQRRTRPSTGCGTCCW